MTPTQKFRMARRMTKAHRPMSEIIAALKGQYTEQQIRDGVAKLSMTDRQRIEAGFAPVRIKQIPPEVTRSQQHRTMLRHTSITALLMNDPLPGESALDRREIKSPSITHDYLDDLIFA